MHSQSDSYDSHCKLAPLRNCHSSNKCTFSFSLVNLKLSEQARSVIFGIIIDGALLKKTVHLNANAEC